MSDDNEMLKGFWKEQQPKVYTPPVRPNKGEGSREAPEVVLTHVPEVVEEEEEVYAIDPAAAPVTQNFGAKVGREFVEELGVTLDEILDSLLNYGASDLHLSAGMKPMMRKNGDLRALEEYPMLSSMNIRTLVYTAMSEEQQSEFEKNKEMDLAYSLPGRSRFRVNVMQQRHQIGAVMRVIPHDIKSLEELGMPDVLNDFASLPRGLVLVTGPTGSGKSTTLAAIVDRANRTRHDHIITIEDPIEFVHDNKGCIVNQREVGVDTASFGEALRRALRQDPDIILLGEMRDYETIATAITAAETGHLVFGTLHTQSAAETMSRIIDSFPDGSKNQVQAQLAATIQGIVCQTLVKTLDGKGRVAAVEILKGEASIRAMIRNGKPEQIQSALETNKAIGMQTLDMHLRDLVVANQIAVDEAINRSPNPKGFIIGLGGEDAVSNIRRRQHDLTTGQDPTNNRGVSMGVR